MKIFDIIVGYSHDYDYYIISNFFTMYLTWKKNTKFYNLEEKYWYLSCNNNDMYKNMFLQLYYINKL